MTYTNRPADAVVDRAAYGPMVDYHDRVRWGPIIAGLVIGIGTQLVLLALGSAIGLTNIAASGAPRSIAGDVGTGVGIWSVISLLISLFVAGWLTARTCGPMSRSTAILNGAILWGTTLLLSSFLLANGVAGAFGALANNAGTIVQQAQQGNIQVPGTTPEVTAQQARDLARNVATAGWSFTIGSLLGLAAAILGAIVGTRKLRNGNYAAPANVR